MNYETIPQIEQWFNMAEYDNWDDFTIQTMEQENIENIFKTHVDCFWKHLDLLNIISLAKACKYAAYTAYYYNYGKFRDFCNKSWNKGIIDFRTFKEFTSEQLKLILTMFQYNKLIFPKNTPNDTLLHIKRITSTEQSYTFYLPNHAQNTYVTFQRPHEQIFGFTNIEIHGIKDITLQDPMIDILLTFKKINNLNLHHVIFNRTSVNILRTITLKNIKITNSDVCRKQAIELAQAILCSKHTITEIHIEPTSEFYALCITIGYILEKIHLFTKLEKLTIYMQFSTRNINKLKKLYKSRSLQYLHIITNRYSFDPSAQEIYSKLEHLINLDILITERDPTLNHNTDGDWI